MSFKRLSSWFISEAGRKFSFYVVGGTGVGVFVVQFVPQTLLIDKYRDIVQLYRKGLSVPVPPFLIERFKKALDLADVPQDERILYKPFSVYGFDIFHAGNAFSKFGCSIGLPVNFSYKDVDSIDKQNIKILGESVQWSLQEAKDFLDALVLSENAQLYAIAREMRMTQSAKLMFDCLYGSIAVYTAYGIGHYLNFAYKFHTKPLGLRMALYGLVSAFVFTNYCLVKDSTQLYYESKVDKELHAKDPLLVQGGLEFYDKILKRNMALRKLMGSEGKHVYSVLGNEIYWLRQPHLPIVYRKSTFENKLDHDEKISF